jgi:magnesium chelatase family protein
MAATELGESSAQIKARVISARRAAAERFEGKPWQLNAHIPSRELRTTYRPERLGMAFLHDELDKERLTARGLHKVIRLSWTLSDLAGRALPTLADVTQAYSLREGSEI